MTTPETFQAFERDAMATCVVCDDVLSRPETPCEIETPVRGSMMTCGTCGTRQVSSTGRHENYFDVVMRVRPMRRRVPRQVAFMAH